MQFGIPITIISGGINPINAVNSKPINPIEPTDQTTPIITTIIDTKTTLKDLKNINNKSDVINNVKNMKMDNSSVTFFIVTERIYGKPEYFNSPKESVYSSAIAAISKTKVPLFFELKIGSFTKTIII